MDINAMREKVMAQVAQAHRDLDEGLSRWLETLPQVNAIYAALDAAGAQVEMDVRVYYSGATLHVYSDDDAAKVRAMEVLEAWAQEAGAVCSCSWRARSRPPHQQGSAFLWMGGGSISVAVFFRIKSDYEVMGHGI